MSVLTVTVSIETFEEMFQTGTVTNKSVVSRGLPEDAELLNIWLDVLAGGVKITFNCPSDTGADQDVIIELTTLRNAP